MAIQPRYAQAILRGDKHVEFRKRRLAYDIDRVLIYETAPTKRVVGMFTVGESVSQSPASLWRKFRRVGGISLTDFNSYFRGHVLGVGLTVVRVERFRRPVALDELGPSPSVPQSFAYLDEDVVAQVRALQSQPHPGTLGRNSSGGRIDGARRDLVSSARRR